MSHYASVYRDAVRENLERELAEKLTAARTYTDVVVDRAADRIIGYGTARECADVVADLASRRYTTRKMTGPEFAKMIAEIRRRYAK